MIQMKTKYFINGLLICLTMIAISSFTKPNPTAPVIKEMTVNYKNIGNVISKGFIAYDDNFKGKRPAILVVPEWWGLNDYPKMRVRQLAAMGYFAMAVDLFGNGKTAANPKEAQELTGPFYKDPQIIKTQMDYALQKIREYPQVDAAYVAAIGYCFGGYVVLNYAKMGADLKGVVSFHGGIGGVPVEKKLLKAKILVCHGASDKFVSQKDVDAFIHQLDSIGADHTLKVYANATHAFTNPASTENGKRFNLPIEYNAAADKDSWNDMQVFLKRIFGH
jgi:dienelactone hydrolase